MTKTNGKATIREVFDLIKPMAERQVRIETTLDEFIKAYEKGHKELSDDLTTTIEKNTSEHKNIVALIHGKISIKAFSLWLSGAVVVVSAILGYLKFMGVL